MPTQKEIHELARSKGWYESFPDPFDRLPMSLMLITSELAECLEEYRNGRGATEIYFEFPAAHPEDYQGKPAGIPIELADAVIRIKDTCESLGIDLDAAIEMKHEFNKTRPYQHGNKRA